MRADKVVEGIADAPHRIQDVHRTLRNIRDLPPAQVLLLLFGHLVGLDGLVLKVIGDVTADHRQRRLIRAEQNFEQGRFAAAGFAGDAIDFALLNLKRNVIDGFDGALNAVGFGDVVSAQVLGFDDSAHYSSFTFRGSSCACA